MSTASRFWTRHFARRYIPQLEALVQALETRVLPQFEDIDGQAERVSQEAWDSFMAQANNGDEDPSECAERGIDGF